MKGEVYHQIKLITTPQELIDLAKEWLAVFEGGNKKSFYKTMGNVTIRLDMDDSLYSHQTGKIVLRGLGD